MIINNIFSGSHRNTTVPLEDLDENYNISPGGISVYRRFYGLSAVTRCQGDLFSMLSDVLERALVTIPDASSRDGHLVYCKTQTHNTFSDDGWLRSLAVAHGLERWETLSWAMTNCASAIVALHYLHRSANDAPVILITGEKAFHPGVSALSVGLLSEIPAASVINVHQDGWHVLATSVRHLGAFYESPTRIKAAESRQLQEIYTDSLRAFLKDSLAQYASRLRNDAILMPHNLNLPVMRSVVRDVGWEERVHYGDVANQGHAYCSDLLLNLDRLETDEKTSLPEQVILIAAGTGVTFASCLLERTRL